MSKEKKDNVKTKKEQDITKEVEKVNKELEAKNKELEKKMNELSTMVEDLLKQQKAKEQKEEEKKVTFEDKYKEIDPTKRVLLMNMVNAGATYKTHSGKAIRFDKFGQIQPARFEDVESFVFKYRSYFENIEVRILDNDAVDALYLRDAYNKYDISKEEMEGIIKLAPQEMIKKVKKLSKPLQESFVSLVVEGIAKNDKNYMDKNKWDVIDSTYNISIKKLVDKYFVS